VASLETWTPSRSFPLAALLPFALVGGFQGTRGSPTNHKLSNKKFTNIHQLFMYYDLAQQRHLPICVNLWIPSTTTNLLLKLETLCCPNKMVLTQNSDTICWGSKVVHQWEKSVIINMILLLLYVSGWLIIIIGPCGLLVLVFHPFTFSILVLWGGVAKNCK